MGRVKELANAYNEEYWNNFARAFPSIASTNDDLGCVPNDVYSALAGIMGVRQVEQWLNTSLKSLEGKKAKDLLKTDEGQQAIKMFILSMPI